IHFPDSDLSHLCHWVRIIESGTLHEGSGQGVFAEAVEGVADEAGMDANGVQIGTPVGVGSNATLTPLGTFRITHYCPCSICCGPYTDGITSTGVTATTNHTIAVEPNQIPYGSKVVINGQVYVAEDCGGGIKTNCIDIYVASHAEGEAKGVFYTDVYLLNEG
ncbi:MAG: 3D domain-containing protein, partial [Eubacteriales bacterium]|nr:3D domain-containing protein [Eubacteriales bacterium]